MLDGVTRLVRGDTERGDARGVVDIRRQAKPLVDRIVVVAEHVVDLAHFDIVDFGGIEDLAGRLRSGHARTGRHLFVFAESRGDPHLGVKPEQQRHADENEIDDHK